MSFPTFARTIPSNWKVSKSVVSLLSSMLTVFMEGHSDISRPPRWIRTIAFRFLAKLFCLQDEIPNIDDDATQEATAQPELVCDDVISMKERKQSKDVTLDDVISKLDLFLRHIREKEKSEAIANEWKLVAKTVDRFLFWICFLITTIYFIYSLISIHQV